MWLVAALSVLLAAPLPGWAQTAAPAAGWNADVEVKKAPPPAAPTTAAKTNNTTVIERGGGETKATATNNGVKLVALLTADGQQIDQGLVWRVFQAADATGKSKLVAENREASPSLKLQPGDYTINASFGRANLTRKVSVKANAPALEQFVLNAGGLRLNAFVDGKLAAAGAVTYAIYSDDRDQFANRTAVMSGAKPSLIIRLNAGIYRIVSTYGDANARVEADVTVEAGKLTETSVAHTAAKATFKLVMRSGGEALPDTRWTIQAADGEIVKESVGALPTHILAPGSYSVFAKSGGRMFKNAFALKEGESASVEVMMDPSAEAGAPADSSTLQPSLEIKSP